MDRVDRETVNDRCAMSRLHRLYSFWVCYATFTQGWARRTE